LSGKPGNVREFGTCQGNIRDVVNSQGIVREMSGKKSCHGKLSQKCSLLDELLAFPSKKCIATYIRSDFIIRNH